MLSGESIFLLPFVIARIFRPALMSTLELDNTQLGNCFSVYGILALIAYFLGAFITDLVAPRKLMALALILTVLVVAVSLISVVGYFPDIFMGPLIGCFLDTYPGELGFKWVFGILAVWSFYRINHHNHFQENNEFEFR